MTSNIYVHVVLLVTTEKDDFPDQILIENSNAIENLCGTCEPHLRLFTSIFLFRIRPYIFVCQCATSIIYCYWSYIYHFHSCHWILHSLFFIFLHLNTTFGTHKSDTFDRLELYCTFDVKYTHFIIFQADTQHSPTLAI